MTTIVPPGRQRIPDLEIDLTYGGVYAGTSFEFSRKLTGQVGLGYLEQVYHDPTLPKITGPVLNGSLLWTADALTSARLFALTTISESPLAGQSGLYERDHRS